uniref:Uncharacterized protein n=1 Tax=Picea sitchensis TaxID=3332 RepID=A0A6B9XV72_PICSI|nr:hypothetical protein Q903MT_gene4065 [Picea sitchensis]
MLAQAYTKSRLHKLSSSSHQAYRQSYKILPLLMMCSAFMSLPNK